MSEIKIVEVKGFSKEEALSTVDFNTTLKGANATQAWIKAGSPETDSKAFKVFVAEQVKSKFNNAAGVGGYVVVEGGVADSRERPYKVISVATEGARKYKSVHQVIEADLTTKVVKEKVTSEDGVESTKEVTKVTGYTLIGQAVDSGDTKGEALELMKELIAENKKSYVVVNAKVEVSGQAIEAFGLYTPSVSAKVGTYIAFGIEA
jgi:hypothetical protein